VLIASLLSHTSIVTQLRVLINENKIKKKINNDLAVVASQIPVEVVHDRHRRT